MISLGSLQTTDSLQRDVSKTISLEQRDYYWNRSETYRKWLLEKVFDVKSDTISIMIFPIEVGKPNYRDSTPPLVQPPSTMLVDG